jgi:hypothetical protein
LGFGAGLRGMSYLKMVMMMSLLARRSKPQTSAGEREHSSKETKDVVYAVRSIQSTAENAANDAAGEQSKEPNGDDSNHTPVPNDLLAEIEYMVRKSIQLGASVQPDYCCLLGVYGIDEVEQRLEFVSMPCRVEERGELLRVHINGDDSIVSMVFDPLVVLIAPFSVCGRDAVFKQTANGFVVILGDARQSDLSTHPVPPKNKVNCRGS